MLERLVLYRNELKNRAIYNYKFIGILVEILYSKEMFPRNKDIGEFIFEVFSVRYKDYVMKSRSLIVSRICKFLLMNVNKVYVKKLLDFVNLKISELKGSRPDGKDVLKGWVK